MVEQDVGEGLATFGGVKGSQVDTSIGERLVGGGEHGKRPSALKRFEQLCLDHSAHQRVVNPGALRCSRDVVGRCRWHQHLIDDVDDTVAGVHVGKTHVRTVDHHAVSDGEAEDVAVDSGGGHAIRDIGCRDGASHDVVEQDVGQCLPAFGGVEGGQVNACIHKRLVGGGKHGERSGTLQGLEQFCLDDSGHEGVMASRTLGRPRDVVGCVGGHEHAVNDVNQTVGGDHIGHHDVGAVHRDAVPNTEGQRLTVDGVCAHAVGHVGRRNLGSHHVVEKDVGQGLAPLGGVQRSQINTGIDEGLIGGSKHGERSWALEGGEQPSLNDGCDQRVVNAGGLGGCGHVNRWAQDPVDDVNDAVGGQDIRGGDVGATDLDRGASDGELDLVPVGRVGHHAVGDGVGPHFASNDMVEEDGRKCLILLRRVEVIQIDTGIGEGLVGRCKHGKRPGLLKRGHQVGVGQRGHQGFVDAGSGGVGRDVLRGVCRRMKGEGGDGHDSDDQ